MTRKHWEIHGSLPPEGANKWRRNLTCHVIAASAMRALQLALEQHPLLEVWSVAHRGEVHIIEDAQPEGNRIAI